MAVQGHLILTKHLICLCSLQDTSDLLDGSAGGYVSGQIYYDAFLARFGHGGGGIVAMGAALLFRVYGLGLKSRSTVMPSWRGSAMAEAASPPWVRLCSLHFRS